VTRLYTLLLVRYTRCGFVYRYRFVYILRSQNRCYAVLRGLHLHVNRIPLLFRSRLPFRITLLYGYPRGYIATYDLRITTLPRVTRFHAVALLVAFVARSRLDSRFPTTALRSAVTRRCVYTLPAFTAFVTVAHRLYRLRVTLRNLLPARNRVLLFFCRSPLPVLPVRCYLHLITVATVPAVICCLPCLTASRLYRVLRLRLRLVVTCAFLPDCRSFAVCPLVSFYAFYVLLVWFLLFCTPRTALLRVLVCYFVGLFVAAACGCSCVYTHVCYRLLVTATYVYYRTYPLPAPTRFAALRLRFADPLTD